MATFPIDQSRLGPLMLTDEIRPDLDRESGRQRRRNDVKVWLADVLWPSVDRRATVETVKIANPDRPIGDPRDFVQFIDLAVSTWTMNGRDGITITATGMDAR